VAAELEQIEDHLDEEAFRTTELEVKTFSANIICVVMSSSL